MTTVITNLRKNCMGTVSFDGMFPGQKKIQDFIVYPLSGEADTTRMLVQSDKRIGYIYPADGRVELCPSQSSGAYAPHLILCQHIGKLSAEDLLLLKGHVMGTAHGAAGKAENGIVQTDNSGAINIFGDNQ